MNIEHKFSNLEEFLTACDGKCDLRDSSRASRDGSSGFAGTRSFVEAMQLAREGGWADGLRRFEATQAAINEAVSGAVAEKQITFHDVCGSMVDIGRFVTGVPENMMEFDMEERNEHGKFIRVVVNIRASAGISAQAMIDRGIAAAAMIDALEARDYRVQVDVVSASTRGTALFKTTIRVKDYSEALDIDRLLFTTAHPSMTRRLCFSFEETQAADVRRCFGFQSGGGYGKPEQVIEGDVYVGAMQLWNETASVAWILQQLKALGIEVTA